VGQSLTLCAYADVVTDRLLRVPEVAVLLGIEGPEVYRLIEKGELWAGKGADGLVYVPEPALREYEERHAKTRSVI
jgi:excisionase family DNA binding protein